MTLGDERDDPEISLLFAHGVGEEQSALGCTLPLAHRGTLRAPGRRGSHSLRS
jgi:hypothetical protein